MVHRLACQYGICFPRACLNSLLTSVGCEPWQQKNLSLGYALLHRVTPVSPKTIRQDQVSASRHDKAAERTC